jgi:flagella basal body P-ring formation protein FlgA
LTNWTGAERIRVTRLSRDLKENEMNAELTALLQREQVKDKGELELHFTRPWTTISIPDEPFTLKILDLPTSGVSSSFILRFEINTAGETLGPWQMPLTAKVWREVWVARSALKRNQSLSEADVAQERRDVLALRDTALPSSRLDRTFEIVESISAGSPIYERSVHARPVIRRGQVVDAQLQDGTIQISLKVEVLENGSPGQLVRVRNPDSKREFRGKVQNEQTILIAL